MHGAVTFKPDMLCPIRQHSIDNSFVFQVLNLIYKAFSLAAKGFDGGFQYRAAPCHNKVGRKLLFQHILQVNKVLVDGIRQGRVTIWRGWFGVHA